MFNNAQHIIQPAKSLKIVLIRLVVFVLLCCSQQVNAQIVAKFSYQTPVCYTPGVGVTVKFKDESYSVNGSPIVEWIWNKGDGSPDLPNRKDPSPEWTYDDPGVYRVTLTVRNLANDQPGFQTQAVVVFPPLNISFTSSINSGCNPLDVVLTDMTIPDQLVDNATGITYVNAIKNWTWDFGDGQKTTVLSNSVAHTYTNSGNFKVRLFVETEAGCKAFGESTSDFIKVEDKVKSDFYLPSPNVCKFPAEVKVSNISEGAIAYQWSVSGSFPAVFSDDTAAEPTISFSQPGTYKVRLKATGANGCVDQHEVDYVVSSSPAAAQFTAPAAACANTNVIFVNTATAPTVANAWFIDGVQVATTKNLNNVFNTQGVKTVRLQSLIGSCTYTYEKDILVHPAPVPVFTSDVRVGCDTPLVVTFTDQTPDPGGIIVQRIWEFGDQFNQKFTTSSSVITHTYKKEGFFLPILTIKTDKGCQIKKIADNSAAISLQFPKITSKNLPDSGCEGLEITPDIRFNIQSSITDWEWEVLDEDGASVFTRTGANPGVFRFDNKGIYKVNLTIKAPPYCEKSYSWPVKVGVTPQAFDIVSDKYEDCANSTFNFFYNGAGPEPTGFKWKFSAVDSSLDRDPSRIFKDLGLHTVSLIVYDNGCPLTVTKVGMINIKGVIADFNVINDCANPLQPRFEDKSQGIIDQWKWSFGDASPDKNAIAAEPPFIHAYTTPDKYKVKLTVSGDGCVFSDSTNITVTNETAIDFNPLAPVCLSDGSTTLKADINNPGFIKNYYWNLGCGERPADGGDFQIMFANTCGSAPYSRGNYRMWVRVIDVNGCEYKSPEKDIYIGGPEADISALTTLSGCENLTVKFEDRSDIDPDVRIVERLWDFGDGIQENILSGPVSHLFSTTGSFPVKLKVTDQAGCTSTSEILEVNTSKINLDFSASQTSSCIAKQIQFEPIASSTFTAYLWEFGDGSTSILSNPKISYASAGNQSVRLTVRDGYGCEAAVFKPNYIEIDMPVASFSAIKSTADCPPFDAQFNFEGKYAQRFEWDFGDGSKSTLPNPEHLFTRAGEYFVKLKVTSPGGCQVVSDEYKIEVSGPRGTASFNAYSCEPFDATFNVLSTTAQYVIIDYGDGQVTDRMPYQSQFLHQYTDTGFFQPKVFLSNTEGCLVRLPVPNGLKTVEVQPVFKPDNNIFCASGDVRFTDLSLSNDKFVSWQWTLGDGATASGKNISHLYNTPGVYDVKLVVKTALGCLDSVMRVALIEINPNPEVEIVVSRPIICEDETADFGIRNISSPNPIVDYFWDFTNGNSSTLPDPTPELFRKKGIYPVRLYVTDSRGCSDTALINYPVNPVPLLDAGADRHLCLGTPEQLNPSGAATYQWSGGLDLSCVNCEQPFINPSEDATYFLRGTSIDGCTAIDSIHVEVIKPSSVKAMSDTALCVGGEIQLSATGTSRYRWTPVVGLSDKDIANPIARPLSDIIYTVTGSDLFNCFVTTDQVVVKVNPTPQVYAGPDTTMMAGYPLQLRPVFSPDVTKVKWEPSIFLSCTDCKYPVSSPSYSATYTLFAYNDAGCVAKDVINVFATCTRENLFIPNTFSPNGDGANEIFYPRGRGIEKIKSLKIFSRWGQLIYTRENFFANDQTAGWNGKRSGLDVSADVYVYMIDLVCENGNIITLKGDITLVR